MKRLIHILTTVFLLAILAMWVLYAKDFKAHYPFSEWIIYLFIAPTVYCFCAFFLPYNQPQKRGALAVFLGILGVIFSILLVDGVFFPLKALKILMLLTGLMVTLVVKRIVQKRDKPFWVL